ncbi:hypothetical protein CYMTET_41749 [Cymbomonas tetramitiformis]|uniref:Chaperone DnaJ C-terminal domain-containing protein n=1 Tax=Cymbomonas tetramitiformis TaxID=36881 RepID=A0AAE0F3A2_9CHLO|nr:hypothetical protein CYMTET_41749 [Cymbomonas tetramitiformis]
MQTLPAAYLVPLGHRATPRLSPGTQLRLKVDTRRRQKLHFVHKSSTLRVFAVDDDKKTPFDEGFWKNLRKQPKSNVFDGPGADVRRELNVSFTDAILGAELPLNYERKVFCSKCKGKGNLPSSPIPCSNCKAEGRLLEEKSLTVTVPAGVQEGSQLSLKQQGDDGNPAGNLIVRISAPSWNATVRRDKQHLYSDAYVSQEDLINGGAVTIETIDGTEGSLKVPQGTKEGAYLRIKGRGAPEKVNSKERGDHYFRLVVK